MTQDEAFDRLSEYVDGGLSVGERYEIESYAAQDADFAEAIILCRTMNTALENQADLQPRLDFTVQVLYKAGIIDRLPAVPPVRWSERFERWAPVLAIVGALLLGASALGGLVSNLTLKAAQFVSTVTGIEAFASYPPLLVALVVPVAAVGFALYSYSGRWQAMRN